MCSIIIRQIQQIIRPIQQHKCSKIHYVRDVSSAVSVIIRRYYKNMKGKTDTEGYRVWYCNSCLKLKIMFKISLRWGFFFFVLRFVISIIRLRDKG